MKEETYLMLDIEVTGPISAFHDLIEFAFVHRDPNEDQIIAFSAALKGFYNTPWRWEQDTFNWWHNTEHKRKVLAEITAAAKDPVKVMNDFAAWIEDNDFQDAKVVAFGCDYEWIKLYWWKCFKSAPPFGLLAVDAKSYAMSVYGCGLDDTHNSILRVQHPELFREDLQHTHHALDDALEQSLMFNRIMERSKNALSL